MLGAVAGTQFRAGIRARFRFTSVQAMRQGAGGNGRQRLAAVWRWCGGTLEARVARSRPFHTPLHVRHGVRLFKAQRMAEFQHTLRTEARHVSAVWRGQRCGVGDYKTRAVRTEREGYHLPAGTRAEQTCRAAHGQARTIVGRLVLVAHDRCACLAAAGIPQSIPRPAPCWRRGHAASCPSRLVPSGQGACQPVAVVISICKWPPRRK